MPTCCSKQSCCIKRHVQRANHKRRCPSTQTLLKHAMPGYAAIIPKWDPKPQLTRGWLDAISAGLCRCVQRQRSGAPLRDTRRALCHVRRRFWQTRYRLVRAREDIQLHRIRMEPRKSDVFEDKQGLRHWSQCISPSWLTVELRQHAIPDDDGISYDSRPFQIL